MPSKNHSKSMSQTERGFWREAFLAPTVSYGSAPLLVSQEVELRARFADMAVQELRKRLTWGRT